VFGLLREEFEMHAFVLIPVEHSSSIGTTLIFLPLCASIFQPFPLLLWQLDGMQCHLVQSHFPCRHC